MKLLLVLIVLIIGVYALISRPFQPERTPVIIQPTATLLPQIEKKLIEYKKIPYQYYLLGPLDPQQISLHSNLPDKKTSMQLKQKYNCSALTSAGFYGTNNQHIGLFVTNNTIVQEQSQNSLFNQYVWANRNGIAGIGQLLPDEPLAFALQTGPLLLQNGEPRTLRLRVDEEARRIAVGIDNNNQMYFYAISQENSSFTGPLLEDLPAIIAAINSKESLAVESVVNLDGGNHSTFQTETDSLLELSPAGGIFCIK